MSHDSRFSTKTVSIKKKRARGVEDLDLQKRNQSALPSASSNTSVDPRFTISAKSSGISDGEEGGEGALEGESDDEAYRAALKEAGLGEMEGELGVAPTRARESLNKSGKKGISVDDRLAQLRAASRGEAGNFSGSDGDTSSSEDEDGALDEAQLEEMLAAESGENIDELDPDAPNISSSLAAYDTVEGEETRRLALVNLDWSQLRAVDIHALLQSCVPSRGGGSVLSVTVYPSEYGLARMEEESREGPARLLRAAAAAAASGPGVAGGKKSGLLTLGGRSTKPKLGGKALINAQEVDSTDPTLLRAYELNKLKYFYAVAECDRPATALALYEAADGLEMEDSSNILDMRFVPDDTQFHNAPRDVSYRVPQDYDPPHFQTRAAGNTRVENTWDDDDAIRQRALDWDRLKGGKKKTTASTKKGSGKKMGKRGGWEEEEEEEESALADLKAYLASDSEEEEDEEVVDEDAQKKRRRALLLGDEDGEVDGGKKGKRLKLSKATASETMIRTAENANTGKKRTGPDEGALSITYNPDLDKELKKKMASAVSGDAEGSSLHNKKGTWDDFLEKRKEKRREKKAARKASKKLSKEDGREISKKSRSSSGLGSEESSDAEDNSALGSDPFFTLSKKGGESENQPKKKGKGGGAPGRAASFNNDDEFDRSTSEEEREDEARGHSAAARAQTRAELELLTAGDDKDDEGLGRNFDMRALVKAQKLKEKEERRQGKKKHDKKKTESGGGLGGESEGKVSAAGSLGSGALSADLRFAAILSNPEFSIDPTAPAFKNTAGMQELLAERKNQSGGIRKMTLVRAQGQVSTSFGELGGGGASGESGVGAPEPSLAALANSVKMKFSKGK